MKRKTDNNDINIFQQFHVVTSFLQKVTKLFLAEPKDKYKYNLTKLL